MSLTGGGESPKSTQSVQSNQRVPTPDIKDFKFSVHINPFPEDSARKDPVLRVLEDWVQWKDKYGNDVDIFNFRAADNGHYIGITDETDSYVKRQYRYVTDSGSEHILQEYDIGYGGACYGTYWIPAEPGELTVRYTDFYIRENSHTLTPMNSDWSAPLRITHGFQVNDNPYEPGAVATDPYIPIEKM